MCEVLLKEGGGELLTHPTGLQYTIHHIPYRYIYIQYVVTVFIFTGTYSITHGYYYGS